MGNLVKLLVGHFIDNAVDDDGDVVILLLLLPGLYPNIIYDP